MSSPTRPISCCSGCASTREITLDGAPSLSLHLGSLHNLGFEGVYWDSEKDDLLIVQEALPLRVMILSGLKEVIEGGPMKVDIRDWTASTASTLFMRDLSSLTLHEPTGHVLLLSHMSRMIVEYASDGRPVSMMMLPGVPQAEGIAVGAQGEIFVVSEPNLFYRYVRQTPAHWLKSWIPAPRPGLTGFPARPAITALARQAMPCAGCR